MGLPSGRGVVGGRLPEESVLRENRSEGSSQQRAGETRVSGELRMERPTACSGTWDGHSVLFGVSQGDEKQRFELGQLELGATEEALV